MTKAEEILEKHLVDYDTTSYTDEDRKLKQCYINAINEALTIPVVSGSVVSIDEQVEIIKQVIDEMMTTFDDENDKKILLQNNYNQQHNLLTGLLKNLKVTDHENTIQQIAHDYLKSINPEKTYYCLDENIKGSNYKCDKQCDRCSKRNT